MSVIGFLQTVLLFVNRGITVSGFQLMLLLSTVEKAEFALLAMLNWFCKARHLRKSAQSERRMMGCSRIWNQATAWVSLRNTSSKRIPPEITTLIASSTVKSVRVTSDAETMIRNPEDGIGVVGM